MYPGEILKYLAKVEEVIDSIPLNEVPDEVLLDVRVKWYGEEFATLWEDGWEFGTEEAKEKE